MYFLTLIRIATLTQISFSSVRCFAFLTEIHPETNDTLLEIPDIDLKNQEHFGSPSGRKYSKCQVIWRKKSDKSHITFNAKIEMT